MSSKTAANVAAVQIFATLSGKPVMNDLYFKYDHQPSHEDLVSLTAAIADVVVETWVDQLSANWLGTSIFSFDMTVADGANAVDDSIRGVLGGNTSAPLPNNATIAIARKNGLRGRSGNGRIFWAGLSVNQRATDNTVTEGAQAAILAAVEATGTAAADLEAVGSILSFQHDGVVSSEATIYPISVWTFTDNQIDTQRRRIRGAT